MRIASCLLLAACLCQAAMAQTDTVGDYGDPERLVIEGAKDFLPKDIKARLLLVAELDLAADPKGTLDKYLNTIERLIGSGYRRLGYRDVEVKAATNEKTRAVTATVNEGPCYQAGEVRIRGSKTIPVKQLIARLTKPYPPRDATMQSPTERRGELDAQWVDRQGKPIDLSDPVWHIGKHAQFFTGPEPDSALHRDVADALVDLGYLSTHFSVDIAADPATKKANLIVDISEEGQRSVIATVTISGNEANSREDILKYVGFRSGVPATRDEQVRIQSKLWRSGRFIKSEVEIYHPATVSDNASLQIGLVEYHAAPPLSKPLSREEEIFLKCRNRLANQDQRDGDLVVQCEGVDYAGRAIFSPTNGVMVAFECKESPKQKAANVVAVMSAVEIGFFNLAESRKTSFRPPNGQLLGSLTLRLDESVNKTREESHSLGFYFGVKSERQETKLPFDVSLSFDPVFFVDMAHDPDTKYVIRDGVLTASSAKRVVRLDASSGKLISYVEIISDEESSDNKKPVDPAVIEKAKPGASQHILRLAMIPGEYRRRLDVAHAAAEKFRNTYDSRHIFSSLLGFVAAEDTLWQSDTMKSHLQARRLIRWMCSKRLLDLFDKAWMDLCADDDSSGGRDWFSIPDGVFASPGMSLDLMRWATCSLLYGGREFAPPGSWPERVGRGAVLSMFGHADAANVDLLRVYKSDKNGPICFLTAATLLADYNPPMAQMMASRGLRRLSLQDFQKEYAVFLDPKYPIGQSVLHAVDAIRSADDGDIKLLGEMLPDIAPLLRQFVKNLRENPKQPADQVLKASLDALWQNGLSQQVKTILETLEKSSVPFIQQSSLQRKRQLAGS
jgi:hypothetical protein